MGSPFFSEKDSDILYGESYRDPLGLLPIWSAVGHALIPGLASIVSRIDGILGILFLFTCLHELPRDGRDKASDDRILRFLERLWEYHLHRHSKHPCFGINSLGAADFQLSTARDGVVGTGLRQYYRGTCVNKKIMAPDLESLYEPYRSLASQMLDKEFIRWLTLKLPDLVSADYTVSANAEYSKVRESLEKFSRGNTELWQSLDKHLLSDAGQKPWIEHVVGKHGNYAELSAWQLVLAIKEYAGNQGDTVLSGRCQRIMDCEPFIQVLQSVFLIAQEEVKSSLPKMSQRLADTAPDNLKEVCENFKRVSFKSHRLTKLKELANHLIAGHYQVFLREFLHDYYGSVCKDRGKNPVVLVDALDIIALKPGKADNTWQNATGSENWENGYFIVPQLSLYTDLMSRMKGGKCLNH